MSSTISWQTLVAHFSLAFILFCNPHGLGATGADTLSLSGLGHNSYVLLPVMFYQEETSFGAGVSSAIYFTKDRVHQVSNIQGMAIYTLKNQFRATVLPKIYTRNKLTYFSGHLRLSHYPDKFFGIGRGTPDTLEEDFTSRGVSFLVQCQRFINRNMMVGVQMGIDYSRVVEFDGYGYLQSSTLDGVKPYFTSGLGIVTTWDTRDNMFYATTGEFYKVSVMSQSRLLGSDFNSTRVTADVRNFFRLTNHQSVGIHLYGDLTWGRTPFQQLPAVGGNQILRGFYQGRYRDKKMLSAQVEYRFPIFWRIRGTVFAAAADVAPSLGKLSIKETRYTCGAGIRIRVNPAKVHIRVDVGVTDGLKPAIYFIVNEAF